MNKALCSAAILMGVLVSSVYAHVVVRPAGTVTGKDQTYTMRVPNEKTSPTVSVQLTMPEEIAVSAVDEKPGWKLQVGRNAAGRVVSATWTGSLEPKDVVEFTFVGRNPEQPATAEWKVIQSYQDGSRSEWTGEEGSRTPASRTNIVKQ